MRQELDSRFRAIEEFVEYSCSAGVPEQVQSYLFRFGTVLICGNIERSVEIIVLSRLKHRAHPRVLSFIKSHFLRGTNLDCAAVEQLLNRFDSGWYRSFCKFIEENPDVKEGISSCYSVRNSVAHGGHVGWKRTTQRTS
jgi:HEPN superfamily RiboL-PSP-like protein